MNDVTANGKVKTVVRHAEFEYALALEPQPRSEVSVAGTCQFQVFVNDVDSEHTGLGKDLG
jgi:hypothetical protein